MKHNLGGNTPTVRFLILFAAIVCLPACAKLPREIRADPQKPGNPAPIHSGAIGARMNINTASAEELEKLPGVGKVLAARIIEHRQNYGPFRRPEELIIVPGISDRKFREMRPLITVE